MINDEIFRTLECILTDKETAEYGKQLAAQEQELGVIKDEETSAKSLFKSRKDAKDKEIKRLSGIINSRADMREIACEIVYNTPQTMKCTIVRTDTGEEVEVRDMTDDEKQLSFDGLFDPTQDVQKEGE